jgi:hypothetical protein
MTYKVKYEHPAFPKDAEFELPLLGLVKNGGTLEVTPEAEQAFVNERGVSVKDAFEDDEMSTLEGTATVKVIPEKVGTADDVAAEAAREEAAAETTTETEDKAGEK